MAKYAKVTSTIGKILVNSQGDGTTHVNIYSHGRTHVGRTLSNFTRNPFTHPIHGSFDSMEGYWYWLATGLQHDELRLKSGFDAKAYGRNKPRVPYEGFEEAIIQGIHCMLHQNPSVFTLLQQTTLPLTHYYCYTNTLKDNPASLFMLKEFDLLRLGKPFLY